MIRRIKPFWQIEMTAENLLKNCECFDKPYLYVDFMIESCKIDLIPLDIKNDNLLGLFGKDANNNKFIGFNKNMIPERILFTKAHELGHFILGHKLNDELLTDTVFISKDPQETEANVFASAFLMPKERVIGVLKEALKDLSIMLADGEAFTYDTLSKLQKDYIIQMMKSAFHTSKQSIEYRLCNICIN